MGTALVSITNKRAIVSLVLAWALPWLGGCQFFALEPTIREQPQKTTPLVTLDQKLKQAINQGDSATVKRLLREQVSPQSELASSGLVQAIAQNRTTLIPIFLQAGVNPNTPTYGGLPLRQALRYNQPAAVQALLAAGANPNAQDGNTDSILQEALFMNQYISFLDGGKSVEHFATLLPTRVTIIRQLLQAGANPNDRDRGNGTTPFMLAAAHGNVELMQLLRQKGASVNTPNAYGETALMYAAWRGEPTAVEFLLQAGAKVNAANHLGRTALIFAVRRESLPVTRLLLAKGANRNAASRETFTIPTRIDYRQQTVLDHAKATGNPELIALIARSPT